MSDETIGLSPAGMARREVIFGELVQAQRARRTKRTIARGAAAGAGALAVGAAAWAALSGGAGAGVSRTRIAVHSGRDIGPPRATPETDRVNPPVEIAIVGNDPTVLARLSASGDAGSATVIGDAELAGWLTKMGRPAGHIRTSGRFLLASDVPQPSPPGAGSS